MGNPGLIQEESLVLGNPALIKEESWGLGQSGPYTRREPELDTGRIQEET